MDGIFVIGADTNVGKTILSAGLMKLSQGSRKMTYWKPIQTGTVLSDDTNDVKTYTELGADCFMEPAYRFAEPLAPRHAAQKWNKTIDVDAIVAQFKNRPDKSRFMIVEGAGGLLVPINDDLTQRDLIKKLGLPVIIAAEDRVGAINHTVLTIEACRQAGIEILGVVLAKAKGNLGNAESITHFGKVEVLAEIPHFEEARTVVAQVGAHPRLRKLMGVASMPV